MPSPGLIYVDITSCGCETRSNFHAIVMTMPHQGPLKYALGPGRLWVWERYGTSFRAIYTLYETLGYKTLPNVKGWYVMSIMHTYFWKRSTHLTVIPRFCLLDYHKLRFEYMYSIYIYTPRSTWRTEKSAAIHCADFFCLNARIKRQHGRNAVAAQ